MQLGVCANVVGIAGGLLWGRLADIFRSDRLLLVIACFGAFASMMFYSFVARPDAVYFLFAACAMVGWFVSAILPVAFDLAVEITFPSSEAVASSLLCITANFFGIIFVTLMTGMQRFDLSDLWANGSLCGALLLATLIALFFRGTHKRSELDATDEEIR